MLTNSKFLEKLNENCKKILILGIGGVSMSSIALMLKKQDYEVVGYDASHGAFTDVVEENGIQVYYNESEIDTTGVACAVYTAAIKEDSPLITSLKEKGIPCVIRAEFLGELMKSYERRIGISGTHGKSTVSGMISTVFMEALRDPTIMIGAGLKGLQGGFRAGSQNDFIFEACEYRDSFLSFAPTVSVVLNVELDHTDYFKNLDQMKNSFSSFMSIAKNANGVSVVNYDNEGARECAEKTSGKIIFYSVKNKSCDVFADNITENHGCFSFDAFVRGKLFTHVELTVVGEFQIGNALAAIAVSENAGIAPDAVKKALKAYTGVARRFEFRKHFNGAEIRDDYAHHPDEIRATLSAASKMGFKRVLVVYQPHTFTRTHDLFDDFVKAFKECDEVVFADIYAAREKNLSGVTSAALADACESGKYVGDFKAISDYMRAKLQNGDLLIIMGAGDIINLEI